MSILDQSSSGSYAEIAEDLSTSLSWVDPGRGDGVAGFIEDAARAAGLKEAALARLIGVSPATLSSWKSRGSIPRDYDRAFREDLWELIVRQGIHGNPVRASVLARRATLAVLRMTDFDPFGLGPVRGESAAAGALDGLCALADFVISRVKKTSGGDSQGAAYIAMLIVPIIKLQRRSGNAFADC